MSGTPQTDVSPGSMATIEEAIADMGAGKMVILVDDEDRENEGDLVVAAQRVDAGHVAFMAKEGRGLICLALDTVRAERLRLEPMTRHNTAPLGTAFTESIDLRDGGGIGAKGRAATIRAAIEDDAERDSFVTPGHVFPLRARPGGVLVRSGQTEGSVDLARLAGLAPAAVICEVMRSDGSMARLQDLLAFGRIHGLHTVTVADLIRHRLRHEELVKCVSQARLPTAYGEFDLRCYENALSGQVHLALSVGSLDGPEPTLVRVHRSDVVPDVFGLDFIASRSNLSWSLRRMAAEGAGVLLYLRPEGGAEPLEVRLEAFGAQARGERPPQRRTGPMGFHDFGIGAQILRDLGLHTIRVITNSPRVFKGLSGFGLEIVGWVPMEGDPEQAT